MMYCSRLGRLGSRRFILKVLLWCSLLAAYSISAGESRLPMQSEGADSNAQLLRGPWLQLRSSTGIMVRWRTDQAIDSVVQCGTNVDNLNLSFRDTTLTTEHQVLLTNLQPETKYYYSIGDTTGVLAAAPDMFFATAPPIGASRATRIWFISDYGFANDGEVAVRDWFMNYLAPAGGVNVWLTGGDNDQIMGVDEDIQTSIFGIYGPVLRNTPMWPTMGNHDAATPSVPGPYAYFDNFTLPTNGQAGGCPPGLSIITPSTMETSTSSAWTR